MEQNDLQRAIMAVLFAAGEPVAASRLCESLGVSEDALAREMQALMDMLAYNRSGIRIVHLENAYQMCSASEQAEAVTRTLETRKPPKLSQSQLETLTVIAYYQPATRAYVEQIRGVDSTIRTTTAELEAGARLVVRERLMTHGDQKAESIYVVTMKGAGSSADVVSRSVAKDNSWQKFDSRLVGQAACSGHTECDAIIMDHAKILAVPQLEADDLDAALIHEAAIGKIAGEQIIKLMTLGLTEQEAEEQIISGFLK